MELLISAYFIIEVMTSWWDDASSEYDGMRWAHQKQTFLSYVCWTKQNSHDYRIKLSHSHNVLLLCICSVSSSISTIMQFCSSVWDHLLINICICISTIFRIYYAHIYSHSHIDYSHCYISAGAVVIKSYKRKVDASKASNSKSRVSWWCDRDKNGGGSELVKAIFTIKLFSDSHKRDSKIGKRQW